MADDIKDKLYPMLFGSRFESDILLVLRDRSVRAHKAILAEASQVFKGAWMLDPNVTEIYLFEDDPAIMHDLLATAYRTTTNNFEREHDGLDDNGQGWVEYLMQLYLVASKYEFQFTKRTISFDLWCTLHSSAEKGKRNLQGCLMVTALELYSKSKLETALNDLRLVVVDVIIDNIEVVEAAQEFAMLLEEVPELCTDLAKRRPERERWRDGLEDADLTDST